eukprot:m51a1_g10031 hypothetical protein (399) ;mRNA; f:120644-122732
MAGTDRPPSGFRLAGLPADGAFCSDVAPAGDVDGDNVGDLVVGAPHASATGPGRAVLVLGAGLRAHAGPLSVAGLLAAGAAVELLGSSAGDFSVGSAVGPAGDLNGDGVDDVAVGAPGEGPNASGALYVVWGHTGAWPRSLRLSAVGTAELPGVVLRGDTSDGLGSAVGAAGDLDGDGVGDLVVGAEKWPWHGDPHGMGTDGKAYVVFGRKNWTSPGVAGGGIDGGHSCPTRAGDLDGDSLDDLAVVVRSSSAALWSPSSGDVNGDGVADYIAGISDPGDPNSREVHVVYGVATPAPRVAKLVLTRGRLTPITAGLLGANTTAQRFEVSVHVVGNTSHGHFALASSPNARVELFTLADVDEGRVIFAHDGSASVPNVTLAISRPQHNHDLLTALFVSW